MSWFDSFLEKVFGHQHKWSEWHESDHSEWEQLKTCDHCDSKYYNRRVLGGMQTQYIERLPK